MRFLFPILLLFLVHFTFGKNEVLPITPYPTEIAIEKGTLEIKLPLCIKATDETSKQVLGDWKETLKNEFDFQLNGPKSQIILLFDPKLAIEEEGYQINCSGKNLMIKSSNRAGLYYGLQTLRQLVLFSKKSNVAAELPRVQIKDTPRFRWRGFMLDESRHFFGVEKVKQLIDMMSFHKLNIFHWHLTDVQGWRIEIKGYPLLTQIGSRGNWSNPKGECQFYTQDQIREIIRYAEKRNIRIVPEIDMPGHATAANKAYPQYSGGGSKAFPDFTFNPGKEETYEFLTNILKEVTVLFPSAYLHMGGDEVHFGNEQWKTNKDVVRLMNTENFRDLKEVEAYFNRRMADTIAKLGKKVLGWDEMVDTKIKPDCSIILWWRHEKPYQLKKALEQGYPVILCPRVPLYFDFVQEKNHKWGRKWGGSFASIEQVYKFPADTIVGMQKYASQIIGIQANLWTETIQNNDRLDFMLFPRIAALAEAGWSAEKSKNYDSFIKRLPALIGYYENNHLKPYHPLDPSTSPEPAGAGKFVISD